MIMIIKCIRFKNKHCNSLQQSVMSKIIRQESDLIKTFKNDKTSVLYTSIIVENLFELIKK